MRLHLGQFMMLGLTQIADCGHMVRVVQRYDLTACPGLSFEFQPLVVANGLVIRRESAASRLPCPGWSSFSLEWEGKLIGGGDVRLNRGSSCSVDIVWGYRGASLVQEPRATPDLEQQVSALVDTAAHLLMADSQILPIVRPSRIERLLTADDRRTWCTKNAAQRAFRVKDLWSPCTV